LLQDFARTMAAEPPVTVAGSASSRATTGPPEASPGAAAARPRDHDRDRDGDRGVTGAEVESLLRAVPVLLLRWDAAGACTGAGTGDGDPLAGRLAGDGWLDALHPDDAERAAALVRSALAGGPDRPGEVGVRLRSGRRWAVLRVEPSAGAGANPGNEPGAEPDAEPGATGALVDATRSLGDTSRLSRMIEGLNRLRRPEEIVRSVLDEGLALLNGATASLHVLSEDEAELVVAGSAGVPEDVLRQRSGRIPLDSPMPATEVLRTGEMIAVRTHAERRERFPLLEEILPIDYTPAFVAVPLMGGDRRPFGVLGIGFRDERDLGEGERAFLADVAAHCALALDRARMSVLAERNQDRLSFLNAVSEALATSLELESTLTRLAEMAVPRLADWCVVRMAGSSGDPRPVVGAAHVEPELTGELARLAREVPRNLGDAGELGAALAEPRPLLRRTGGAEVFAGLFGTGGADRVASVGVEAVAAYPLTARGRLLGALTFGNRPGRPMADDDLDLMRALAGRAATLVDNARLFHEQSVVARALQDSLLPGSLPAIPGLELGARYRPAGRGLEVGGDFYDAFQADANWWIVAVGDVCGHGVEAAAMTGLVRHTIRAAAMSGAMPSAITARLNEMLLRQAAEQTPTPRDLLGAASLRFSTVVVGAVQPTARGVDLVLCLGGHPSPLVRRNSGEVVPVGVPGTLLGVMPEVALTDTVVHLDPGEALVCFTDGLTDRRAGDRLFGEEGVAAAVARGRDLGAPALAGLIEEAAVSYVDDEPTDDMAVLTLVASPPAADAGRTAGAGGTATDGASGPDRPEGAA
jgi:serine phosphatase RsbU (regulator of sigma subunit)